MKIVTIILISIQGIICILSENSTTPSVIDTLQGTTKSTISSPLIPSDIGRLRVKQTSYHDPSGTVSCSIAIADDTEQLQLTDDNFGYPKFMVEDEFRNNKLATQMFQLYLRRQLQNDNMNDVKLHLENSNSISQDHSQDKSPKQPILNPFTNNNINPRIDGSNVFGNQFPQSFGNRQSSIFGEIDVFPKTQNSGFQGFDFSSPIANTKAKTNVVTNGFHFPSGGIPIFRKKRMSGFETTFTGFKTPKYLCDSQTTILRRYKGYSGKCFLIEPEVQNINFVKCKKEKCSSCNDFSGVTQCSPESMEIWMWVYCENLPQGKRVIYEKIKIPTHCSCKTFQC